MKNSDKKEPNIPSTGFIFSVIALLSSLALATNLYFSLAQNKVLYQSKLDSIKQQIDISFDQTVNQLNTQLSLLITHYRSMPAHVSAMKEKRRDALYEMTISDYRHLRQMEPHFFVMHYFDTKNITILRMHKPQSYGDDLSKIRPIVAHVNRTQTQASGFEPGKNGITYRITTPVFDDQNKHIGVLEFGITLDYFIEQFEKWFDVKSQVLVKSSSLQNLSYKTSFKQLGEHSVLFEDNLFKSGFKKANFKQNIFYKDGKAYLFVNDIHLNTYDGQPLVTFNLLSDITSFHEQNNQQIQFAILFNVTVIILFLIGLYIVLNKYKTQVAHAIEKLQISERKQQYFKESSQKDELTGALNRRSWNLHLSKFLKQSNNSETDSPQVALLFFDIDHFKSINDNYGHLIGDDVLKRLAKIVRHEFRANDHFYRWGGEEFCLLLEGVNQEDALGKAEHLRKTVKHIDWPEKINITISLGVTQIKQDDSLSSLQNRMDKLMYQAKTEGRDRSVLG